MTKLIGIHIPMKETTLQIKDILDSAHEQLSSIFAHEATPHSIRQLDKDHRITSHLDRVRKAFK